MRLIKKKQTNRLIYYRAYKTLIKGMTPKERRKVLDRTNDGPERLAFAKSVIAMAELDDN